MNIRKSYFTLALTIAIGALLFTAAPAGANARLPQTAQNRLPVRENVQRPKTMRQKRVGNVHTQVNQSNARQVLAALCETCRQFKGALHAA